MSLFSGKYNNIFEYMIGHVYIKGQIGNSYDENGNVTKKGVELIDVVEQVQGLGQVEQVIFHIDSPGGYVSVGESIANFIKSLPNAVTIAENLCASIATAIHLAVPLQNRKAVEGVDYIIHNPFLQNVTGDASKLQDYADSIKETEKELVSMYSSATGVSKEAISGLMAVETALTSEQCLKMKFISEILPKENVQMVALIYNEKQNEMKKPLLERTKEALAKLGIKSNAQASTNNNREALAMTFETDLGELETPFSDLMIGDPASIEGAPAPDGTYTAVDGSVITVVGGFVTDFTLATPATVVTPDANAQLEILKAEFEALKSENETLKAENNSLKVESEEVVAELEKLANVRSTYVPPAQAQSFRKVDDNNSKKSLKEQAQEKRANYKQK